MKTVLSNTKRFLATFLALAMVVLSLPGSATAVLAAGTGRTSWTSNETTVSKVFTSAFDNGNNKFPVVPELVNTSVYAVTSGTSVYPVVTGGTIIANVSSGASITFTGAGSNSTVLSGTNGATLEGTISSLKGQNLGLLGAASAAIGHYDTISVLIHYVIG